MERQTEIPELNGFAMSTPVFGVKVSRGAAEGETFERSQPGKPLRRIGNQRQDAFSGRNDDRSSIRPNLNQGEGAGLGPRRLWAREGGRPGGPRGARCRRSGSRRLRGSRGNRSRSFRRNGRGHLRRRARSAQQNQGEFRDLSLESGHLSLEERELMAHLGDFGRSSPSRMVWGQHGKSWRSKWRSGLLLSGKKETTIMQGC